MGIALRIFLIIIAILAFVFVLRTISRKKLSMNESIFWFMFSLVCALLAIFPQIAVFFSGLLGIESPANFIFLLALVVILIRELQATIKISRLNAKITSLTQEIAIQQAHMHDKSDNIN